MSDLLNEGGLLFELAGAFFLAVPGLWRPSKRAAVIGSLERLRVPGVVAGILLSGCAPALLVYGGISRLALWLIGLFILVCLMPLLLKWASEFRPGIGEPTGDAKIEQLHARGFALLAIGFLLQSLGAALR